MTNDYDVIIIGTGAGGSPACFSPPERHLRAGRSRERHPSGATQSTILTE